MLPLKPDCWRRCSIGNRLILLLRRLRPVRRLSAARRGRSHRRARRRSSRLLQVFKEVTNFSCHSYFPPLDPKVTSKLATFRLPFQGHHPKVTKLRLPPSDCNPQSTQPKRLPLELPP
jgi:hypothetical protein